MDRAGRTVMVIRQLRGLRVQLLLWTIFPLAAVLIVLSFAGISRHRQVMVQMVEDRDRGLTTAEASRLARAVEQGSELAQRLISHPDLHGAAVNLGATVESLAADASETLASGLAVYDPGGGLLFASSASRAWAGNPAVSTLAETAGRDKETAYSTLSADNGTLLIATLAVDQPDRVLIAGMPIESFGALAGATGSSAEIPGDLILLDENRRLLQHVATGATAVDLALLPVPPASAGNGATSTRIRSTQGQELLVSYAAVNPPGWTLYTTEDLRAVSSMGMTVVEVLPLLLLFVAVLALLAVTFGVANVVRPLQELDRIATRVAWGDFDAAADAVGGVREIDDLRTTLMQMTERLRGYQTSMRDYLASSTQAQEEERARLARELHDDTVQALIALRQRVQMARKTLTKDPLRASGKLDELDDLIEQELVALRRLISNLRPIYLEDLGFVPALQMLARETQLRHGIETVVNVIGNPIRLPGDLELAAYRIVQQAVSNVVSHAHASEILMRIEFAGEDLALQVVDNGHGFEPPAQPSDLARQGHFGLMGMRERALLYGGRLSIESSAGSGTTITAHIPIP